MKKLLVGEVITPFRTLKPGGVLIDGDRILHVDHMDVLKEEVAEILDFGDARILPGFVDIHVHGGGGSDTMDATPEAVCTVARTHVRGGTTSLLPTTLTAPMEEIRCALLAVKEISRSRPHDYGGARVLGAHVEGPYFNPKQAGAQNPEYLRYPDVDEFMGLIEGLGIVRRVSLAPELPGALDLIGALKNRGIVVSIGHSDARYDEVLRAAEAGATHITHVFSGMSSLRRIRSYRIPGVLETALLLDSLTVEIIADGHHLPPSLIRLVLKCKGIGNVCGVTDAMSAAGMGEGSYTLGGMKVVVENEVVEEYEVKPEGCVAKLENREAFAGSVVFMNEMLRYLVRLVGLPLGDAVQLLSFNPARIMGVDHMVGILAADRLADIVVIDEDFRIIETFVEGKEMLEMA